MSSSVGSGRSSASSSPKPSEPSTTSDLGTPATEKDVCLTPLNWSEDKHYILVTGGLGFIGSHTSLELLKTGYNIIIVDDLSNSFRSVFDRILRLADRHYRRVGGKCPKAKLYDINYSDPWAIRALLESQRSVWDTPDERRSNIVGVIHFAAFKAVEESIRSPLKYYRNNINGLVDLLDILNEFNIKTFIFSSSATVYGTLANTGLPIREEHCVHEVETYEEFDGTQQHTEPGCTGLTNPYGRTKFFGEAILADLATSDPSWTIMALRYFNPIGCDASGLLGEDPKGTPSNLLPVVVKVMTGQLEELSIYGSDWNTEDGTAVRDFIHVTDLAKGHIAALSAARRGRHQNTFRTFNLGTGSGNSVIEVIKTMESVTKLSIPRRKVGRRAGDVGSCVAVADRAENELGWKTEKSLTDACRDIYNFLAVRDS